MIPDPQYIISPKQAMHCRTPAYVGSNTILTIPTPRSTSQQTATPNMKMWCKRLPLVHIIISYGNHNPPPPPLSRHSTVICSSGERITAAEQHNYEWRNLQGKEGRSSSRPSASAIWQHWNNINRTQYTVIVVIDVIVAALNGYSGEIGRIGDNKYHI